MRRSCRPRIVAAASVFGLICGSLFLPSPAQADSVRAGQWYLGFLDVAKAHQYSQGAGVSVAVIDTGVDATHPDLTGSVSPGVDTFPGGGGDGRNPTDEHGTRMAGLIAGHGHGPGDSLGILGIAPKATILPVRVSEGRFGSDIATAIEWAMEHRANVISISLADPFEDNRERQAIEVAISHGIVVVAAAGNTPSTGVQYPAAYPGVVAVAGVDERGGHGDFSVTGPQVVLAAPGANIMTTSLRHGYDISSGTSDSTAIVAGVVALVRSRYPKLSATEVIYRLTATAIDKGPAGRDNVYGYGIINPVGALAADIPSTTAIPSAMPTEPGGQPTAKVAQWTSRGWILFVVAVVLLIGLGSAIAVSRWRRRNGAAE